MEKVRKSVRRTSRATTIDEVAALAKVSPMTVSRVVNNTGSVRDATRERVMRAVDKLGYTPNLAASALAAAQSTRIALIYSDPSGAYLRELLLGVLRVASRTSIQLVIDCWDDLDADAERKAARKLAKGVAGVILPPPLCESRAAVLELVRAKVPVVAIASNHFSPDVACVRIDEFAAAKEITEHLIAQGHARIGYIAGHPNLSASTRRFEGFQAALADAGLRLIGTWCSRATTPTNPGWLPRKNCWRANAVPAPSSPATTTWPPRQSRSRTGVGWMCRAICRWSGSTTPLPPLRCGPKSPPCSSPSPPWPMPRWTSC